MKRITLISIQLIYFLVIHFLLKKELNKLISNLIRKNKKIYTYGATAKGNTLLNFLGITSSQIKYCIDNTEIKQGKFLLGIKYKNRVKRICL